MQADTKIYRSRRRRLLSSTLDKQVEPTTGLEPVDLFLTKEALYRLSYVG